MKVGYVLKKFPKLSETFVLNEILALEEHGVEVDVFSLSMPDETRIHGGVGRLRGEIHQIAGKRPSSLASMISANRDLLAEDAAARWDAVLAELAAEGIDPARSLRHALEIACMVHERGIERLHAHFHGPAARIARLAAALASVPFSFTCHAKDIYHETVVPEDLVRMMDDADCVVTVCQANRDYLERLAGRPVPQLHLLYNGIDTSRFRPAPRRADASQMILGVGRLVEKKGFTDLIAAMARLTGDHPELRCVIAGEGRERETLESQVAAAGLGDRVTLVGAVDQEEVLRRLGEATLLVLPCVVGEDGNRDALPTVILEAMASGVPVVSTPVGGVAEMLAAGSAGELVPERDPDALAARIHDLLFDPARRERLATAGRQKVEQDFDLRTNVARLIALFQASAEAPLEVAR